MAEMEEAPRGGTGKAGSNGPRVTARPSLRTQADAHRASKGSRLQRLNKISNKAEKQYSASLRKTTIAETHADIYSSKDMARIASLQKASGVRALRARAVKKAADSIRAAKVAKPAPKFDMAAHKASVEAAERSKVRKRVDRFLARSK